MQGVTVPTPSVPANVASVAAANGLGPFQRMFVPLKRNWFLIAFVLLVALATVILLFGLYLLWWIFFRTPNFSRTQAARRVYVFEQGFIVADRPDDPQVYRWDNIDTVFQKIVSRGAYGVETGKEYTYTITRRDGQTVKLTDFWQDIATLGSYVNESVSRALLPGAVDALNRGQGVQFGDLTLTANGIAGKRKSVTWAEVSQVRVSNGYVSVGVQGKFLSLSTTAAANLPNLPLFFALTDRLQQTAR
jgi:hypothetical protein